MDRLAILNVLKKEGQQRSMWNQKIDSDQHKYHAKKSTSVDLQH